MYEFRKAEQLSGETLDAFVTQLRTLARDCEFTNVDNEIKAQMTQKCRSSKARRCSSLDGITLKEVLDYGRAVETAEQEASLIEATTKESVNKVYVRKHTKPFSVRPKTTTTRHHLQQLWWCIPTQETVSSLWSTAPCVWKEQPFCTTLQITDRSE